MTTKYICVYCGASDHADPVYKNVAIELGKLIGKNKLGLVYGGGRLGLMGLVADAVLQEGGQAVGFTTKLLEELEQAHPGLTDLTVVDTMHTRKMHMSEKADMFVVLPGGFGTLDELFEIIVWRQLAIHSKPIIVVNTNGYWDPLEALFHHIFDYKFARLEHKNVVHFVKSADEAIEYARSL